jgi:hypothetical protein
MPMNSIHKDTTNDGHNKPPKHVKPSLDLPLFAHRDGQWGRKIKGRLRYFGPGGGHDEAGQPPEGLGC